MRHKKFSSVGKVLNPLELYKTNREVNKLVIHCTATVSKNIGVDANMVDGWHRDRWGSGIGYHYLVKRDGTLEKGRWVDYIGSHAKGENVGSIGIVYSGGVKVDPSGKLVSDIDNLTTEQLKTLTTTVDSLKKLYGIDTNMVFGHRELPNVAKDCPCMDMDAFRNSLS